MKSSLFACAVLYDVRCMTGSTVVLLTRVDSV